MAEWWAARSGISRHPKTYRLAEALEVDDAAGLGYVVRLYDFAATYRERGDLDGLTDREIARGCGWTGDSAAFVAALRTAGLLDGHQVHDWLEIQGPALSARDKARQRMQRHRSRNETRTEPEPNGERSGDQSICLSVSQSVSQSLPPAGGEKITRSAARHRFRELDDVLARLRSVDLLGAGPERQQEIASAITAALAEQEQVRLLAFPESGLASSARNQS